MSNYQEHIVCFVDLLGFSEANYNNEVTKHKVLDLLMSLATSRGDFNINTKTEKHGHSTTIRPAISTFSDHIVISYPVNSLKEHSIEDMMIISFLQKKIGLIANKAIPEGFLLRGGITSGLLYHNQGIVFGEALIEAYNMESKIAFYPRIIISEKVISKWKIHSHEIVNEDNDGIKSLNYLNSAMHSRESSTVEELQAWITRVSSVIDSNIDTFHKNGDLKKLSKWVWFKNTFNIFLSESIVGQLLNTKNTQKNENMVTSNAES